MRLKPISNAYVDISKISYVGPLDKTIKHDVKAASTTHFFLVIVDGHAIQIQDMDFNQLEKNRSRLIDELTQIPGYMPG